MQLVTVLCLTVGITFVTWSSGHGLSSHSGQEAPYNWGSSVVDWRGRSLTVADIFKEGIKAEDISEYLKTLTESPHIAGSIANRELAEMVQEEWSHYGFDSLELVNYTVLLSYPNASQPNTLTLRTVDGGLIYNSHIQQEQPLTPGEDSPYVVPPFNAYSGTGTVKGHLLYVNYGTLDDFQYLANSTGLNLGLNFSKLDDFICIARYGQNFRGNKAQLAQKYGCKGLLIFSDPQDYAPEGVLVYPYGPSLPEFGVQRGSLRVGEGGDVLTPGVPAIPGIHRQTYSDAIKGGKVVHIPVQPMSYGDAIHFMRQLSDHTPPHNWLGGLNVEYRIMQSQENTNYTELTVNNYQKQKTVHNVVAKLYGAVEPDRQVILGNHRDAWVFGAADPNSGTAALMSIAKVIGQLRTNFEWRPGRTLILCSWGAEEYGLIGSTEWVEEFSKLLEASTLAYLNVDVGITGSYTFFAYATPILYEVIWEAARMVDCPNKTFATVYDEWLSVTDTVLDSGASRPLILDIGGGGSDYVPFLQRLGISVSTFSFIHSTTKSYPVYHSVHDNYFWMSHFGDPPFTRHRALASVWIIAALILTTTPLPPIDPTHYSSEVLGIAKNLRLEHGQVLEENGISLDRLLESALDFAEACEEFQQTLIGLHSSPSIAHQLNLVRLVNDKLMNIERAFILPQGLPGRPYIKHLIYAPSSVNGYGSSLFPGVSEPLLNITQSEGGWGQVASQVDLLSTHLRHASQIVREPTLNFAPIT